ncbi:MAG: hypothetical protein COA67_08955 [Lutibacter sp.]|nr:MAG: hypothetical protein COA67_08955 [Lutibacter sp.]
MDYLLKTSAITFIFYGFYKLILQRETFFQSNRWFLLIGVLTAVLIPLITIPIYVESISTPLFFTDVGSNTSEYTKEAVNWSEILIIVYSIGVAFLGGKFILNLVSLYRLISSHSKEKDRNYHLIKTTQNTTPFSFFNFIVYNPTKFKDNELNQILIHEKVHAQQLHSIDILISQITTILFWFNPFMWLYKKEVQQNLEFIADDLAQQKSNCEKSYQKLLLKTSLPQNQLALTNNFYNSLIKKRIIMLHKNRSKSTNQWKYVLILPIIATFIFTFNTKVVAQNKTVEKEIVFEEDTQMIIVTKDSKKSDFEKIKKIFSKEGVTANFKNIKRNSDGEITSIGISVKSKQSNANYSTSSDTPIKPISISFDNKGDNISIGNSEMHRGENYFIVSKGGEQKVHSTKKGNGFVFISKEGTNKTKDGKYEVIDIHEENKDNNSIVWVTKNGENIEKYVTLDIIEEDKNENQIFISDQEDNLLYFIDGKKATKKDIDKLETDRIEKMEVLKGDKATKKYGEKAKDGVILITTKGKK